MQRLAQIPHVDPAVAGQCIASDVGLSAVILKTLNSSFYGMSRTITDITQATILLGISSVLSLFAANKIKSAIQGESCISLERFWDTEYDVAHVMTFTGRSGLCLLMCRANSIVTNAIANTDVHINRFL